MSLGQEGSMQWTLARVGSAAVFGLALCTACTFGQVGMDFNGSVESPALYHPGEFLDFHVTGPAGSPFAALISPHRTSRSRPTASSCRTRSHPEAVVFFDGFDPFSPTYGIAFDPPTTGAPSPRRSFRSSTGSGYAPSYSSRPSSPTRAIRSASASRTRSSSSTTRPRRAQRDPAQLRAAAHGR